MAGALLPSPVFLGKRRSVEEEESCSMSVDASNLCAPAAKRNRLRNVGERIEINHCSFDFERSALLQSDFGWENRVSNTPLSTLHSNTSRRNSRGECGGGGDNGGDFDSDKKQTISALGNSSGSSIISGGGFAPQSHSSERQYHESVLLSMKTQFDMQMDSKNKECDTLKQDNKRLADENVELRQRLENATASAAGPGTDSNRNGSNSAIAEENRILKRAVAIQDGRHRELQAQHEQLQAVLTAAAEHVHNLEQANAELAAQLQQQSGGGGYSLDPFPPRPPPDVF